MHQRHTSFAFVALVVISCSANTISFSGPDRSPPPPIGTGGVSASSTGFPTTVTTIGSGTGGVGGTSAGSGGGAGSDEDSGSPADGDTSDATPNDAGGGAPDDADYGTCATLAPDTGNACRDQCLCSACTVEAVRCYTNAICRDLAACAYRVGCLEVTCLQAFCSSELVEAGTVALLAATSLGNCYSARCSAQCDGDARPDVVIGDGRRDVEIVDASRD
jgi:hypothetical protein